MASVGAGLPTGDEFRRAGLGGEQQGDGDRG
jgi:hypothetical protein